MVPQLVTHIRNYVELSDDEAQTLLAFTELVPLKKKAFLFEEGQVCPARYFVEKGCLRLFFVNDKGTEQITQFAIENWWIADYMSFGMQTPSGFYLQAIEPSEVRVFPKRTEDELLKALPQLERYFRIILQRAFAAWQLRFKYHFTFSREEQYHHFNSLHPEFVQRIPQYMLASYLGFTPEYLSEIRKKVR
jgi:CRP/FNR family transcriptional regulator